MQDFQSSGFIEQHINAILDFYAQHAIDPQGGFFQTLNEQGEVFHPALKQLVSSARLSLIFALGGSYFDAPEFTELAEHGLDFIEKSHWDETRQGYNWILQGDQVVDATNHCYGLAFVLLTYSQAAISGVAGTRARIAETFELMEQKLWQPEYGLYADQASPDWRTIDPYRGQNANMHSCEAMIAAYEVTGERKYLDRAVLIAENICLRQTQKTAGLIWEHYDQNWQLDWDYNKHDPRNLYRPWGYQPGHLIEWAKLLLLIRRHVDIDWLVGRAEELFEAAMTNAWDAEYGGIFYGFAPDGKICDDEKYFWVHAEAIAATALLAAVTRRKSYWSAYTRIWNYSWEHFCESDHRPWWRLLNRQGENIDPYVASPGAKIDYHTVSACFEVLRVLNLC